MIRYTLTCSEGHEFESWFPDGQTFNALQAAGHLSCSICGCDKIEKKLMTPCLASGRKRNRPEGDLSSPQTDTEKALTEMREHIDKHSEYVGSAFAQEARAIHEGEKNPRSIYGEANLKEAKHLVDNGVPILPLPFLPVRKAN